MKQNNFMIFNESMSHNYIIYVNVCSLITYSHNDTFLL